MIRLDGDSLRKAWPQLRPMIEKARKKSRCTVPFIVEDIYHQCMIQDTFCYVTGEGSQIDGVLFLRPVNNFGEAELHIWIGTFQRPAKLSDHIGFVEGLGRHIKAKRITCLSPRMFDKMWPNSKAVSKRFEKEL